MAKEKLKTSTTTEKTIASPAPPTVKKDAPKCSPAAPSPEPKFEVIDFILRHFRTPVWKEFKGLTYTSDEVNSLLDAVIPVLRAERTLCRMSGHVTIVGDLNGHFKDLIRVLNVRAVAKGHEHKQVFATERFCFLGDYIEANALNLETICLLFGLKVVYVNRYILLRGHQETCAINETSAFKGQIIRRFPKDHENIWKKFKTAFSLLPIAAVIGEKILCVHGGISPEIKKSVLEIEAIPKESTVQQVAPMVFDLMFACPLDDDAQGADSDEPQYFMSPKKDFAKRFNEAAVKDFCTKTGIELVVRSHEVPEAGFRFFAEKRMITIFSVARYRNGTNKGAFLKVSSEGHIQIIQLRAVSKEEEARRKERKIVEKSGETKKKEDKSIDKSAEKKKEKSKKIDAKKEKSIEKSTEKTTEKTKTTMEETRKSIKPKIKSMKPKEKSIKLEKKKSEKKVSEKKKSEKKLETKTEIKAENKQEEAKKTTTPVAVSKKNSKEIDRSVFDNVSEKGPSPAADP